MADMYVPLFGQRLAHLVPVAAGFLGVSLAVGWTISEIVSASLTRTRVIVRVVAAAPLVMAVGLGIAAVSQRRATRRACVIAVWVVGALDHRYRRRHGVAASVRVGDGQQRRSRRGTYAPRPPSTPCN